MKKKQHTCSCKNAKPQSAIHNHTALNLKSTTNSYRCAIIEILNVSVVEQAAVSLTYDTLKLSALKG